MLTFSESFLIWDSVISWSNIEIDSRKTSSDCFYSPFFKHWNITMIPAY